MLQDIISDGDADDRFMIYLDEIACDSMMMLFADIPYDIRAEE